MKRKKRRQNKNKIEIDFAKEFAKQVADNEDCMGEGAAYYVACEQMGVDPEEGWDILRDSTEACK